MELKLILGTNLIFLVDLSTDIKDLLCKILPNKILRLYNRLCWTNSLILSHLSKNDVENIFSPYFYLNIQVFNQKETKIFQGTKMRRLETVNNNGIQHGYLFFPPKWWKPLLGNRIRSFILFCLLFTLFNGL